MYYTIEMREKESNKILISKILGKDVFSSEKDSLISQLLEQKPAVGEHEVCVVSWIDGVPSIIERVPRAS